MWFPEEPITYCHDCRLYIPSSYFWHGFGTLVSSTGTASRTMVLHSVCPRCGSRQRIGLEGSKVLRWMQGLFWKSRYPPYPTDAAVAVLRAVEETGYTASPGYPLASGQ